MNKLTNRQMGQVKVRKHRQHSTSRRGVYAYIDNDGNEFYRSMIKVNYKLIHLVQTYDFKEACQMRKKAEIKYFGCVCK